MFEADADSGDLFEGEVDAVGDESISVQAPPSVVRVGSEVRSKKGGKRNMECEMENRVASSQKGLRTPNQYAGDPPWSLGRNSRNRVSCFV